MDSNFIENSMEIKLVESEIDLLEIITLQHDNHFENVPTELKETNGFATVKHNVDLLQ